MAKMKVKKRKKISVFRVGSERFKQELDKGRTVRVSLDDWLNYWGQQGKDLRAKEEFEREYIRIKSAYDEVVLKLDQATEQAVQKIQQRNRIIVALLLPWAAVLGPARLHDQINHPNGVDLGVDPETSDEIQHLMNEKLREILADRNFANSRGSIFLQEMTADFSGRVRDIFQD